MKAQEQPFGRNYWEDRYAAPGHTWSGNPNPVLVAEAAALAPGRALDIGSGEGGDAIWLALGGWHVMGIDIAENALQKARARAEAVDLAAADRIDWQQRDLTVWGPEPLSYDLVSAQFMHLPLPTRTELFRSLAAAVAPGGTLLIVGHDVVDVEEGGHRAHLRHVMFDVDEVVSAIAGESLAVEVAESRPRQVSDADGGIAVMHDVVVRAVRSL
ncbi:class I SAM-dependent methyltransferase [Arthrobacter sp. 35W]|uniref:class I SAM-dependent methyltransferase n=1 Tax=Arthrobacter sp. 35W TaxID=1132441 RepID=UPI000409EA9E|nr:class I SAM-dependent methyltransferase [Arthrobacter sp. 35W]